MISLPTLSLSAHVEVIMDLNGLISLQGLKCIGHYL